MTLTDPEAVDRRQTVIRIVVFLAITFAISGVGYAIAIVGDETSIFLLAAPAIAALITRYAFQRNVPRVRLRPPPLRSAAFAYALPIVLAGLVFLLAWLLFD